MCGSAEVRTPSPRDAVERFYAAQNAGDTDQIAALMADDVEYHDMVTSRATPLSQHLALASTLRLRCVVFPGLVA